MQVVFDPALVQMFEANRLPHSRPLGSSPQRMPDRSELKKQLELAWKGSTSSLSPARRRAFIQLIDHCRDVDPQAARVRYLMGDRDLDRDAVALVEDLATFHAYTATVTIALIDKAKRANGVLPSTEFYWAREADPSFWLMINGFGRLKYSPDIAGAFAHYEFEMLHGRSLETFFEDCKIV
jgi:hypothetical protein